MTGLSPILQGLRGAARALVRAVGGQEAAAATSTRVKRHQTFSDFVNPNGTAWMPIDAVVELEAVTRDTPSWPQVTRYLAQQTGHVLVRLPDITTADLGDVREAIARHAKESGEATAKAIACLFEPNRDGRACALREMDEAIEWAVITRALIEQLGDDA